MPDDALLFGLQRRLVYVAGVSKGQCDDCPKQGASRVYGVWKPVLMFGLAQSLYFGAVNSGLLVV